MSRSRLPITLLVVLLALPSGSAGVQPSTMSGAMDDLRTLCASETNAGRLAALKRMLFLRGLPYTVEKVRPRTAFVSPQPPEGRNVLVTLGKGPEDIVVCAHYDVVVLSGGELSRGAVDNGAAVVTLVRVAEALKKENLRHRVRILFTDKEEANARGSNRYAWDNRNDPVRAAIVLDLIASGSSVYYYANNPPPPGPESGFPPRRIASPPMMELTDDVCDDLGLTQVVSGTLSYTDQRSFNDAGIPSVWIAVLPEAKAHQLWLSDNSKSAGLAPGLNVLSITGAHSEADRPEAVTPEAMEIAYNLTLALVRRLDRELR